MSIQLDLDNTISFERPLTRTVKQEIRITNPHSKPIAFKVKTTAPKLYCVRPNSDIIPPNGFADVQIMLQSYKEEPPLDVKCKDKFLILSTLVEGPLEAMALSDLWAYAEGKARETIHEKKLRCIFTVPADNTVPTAVAAATQAARVPTTETEANITTTETTATATTTTTTDTSSEEKIKQMEAELKKYKKEVESLRESEPIVLEKVQVKTTGYPISMFILFALLAVAVAYFFQLNNATSTSNQ